MLFVLFFAFQEHTNLSAKRTKNTKRNEKGNDQMKGIHSAREHWSNMIRYTANWFCVLDTYAFAYKFVCVCMPNENDYEDVVVNNNDDK